MPVEIAVVTIILAGWVAVMSAFGAMLGLSWMSATGIAAGGAAVGIAGVLAIAGLIQFLSCRTRPRSDA